MNKKGFVFIEMIVTTVILLVALLVLYSTYSKVISNEKQRMYFDDISYVYKGEKIRDVVASSVDYNNFYKNVNENKNGYVYLFGPQSEIFLDDKKTSDSKNIQIVWDLYHVSAIGYISISDIPKLKQCLNDNTGSFSTEEKTKCTETKKHLTSYSKAYITAFLKTLDVDYNSSSKMYTYTNEGKDYIHDGIFIILFSESKNGEKISNSLTYNKCIQDHASDDYEDEGIALCNREGKSDCNLENTKKVYAVKAYNKDDKSSYDMACENGYNIVWVYF